MLNSSRAVCQISKLTFWRLFVVISTMKRDKEPHNEKYRVEYHINNNSTDVLNMMDGLSMEPEREEEGDRCVYINPRSVVIAEST